ncbi:MAG: hypothetical protein MUE94_10460 [Verrucomicrobia bacterium]|jgi:hypothetical protein|nr:hypothetical protein [Verrucomicrobiota bacterium]
MFSTAEPIWRVLPQSFGGRVALSAAILAVLFFTGCGKLPGLGTVRVEAKTAEDNLEAFLTYQEALMGKDYDAVKKVFGKPKGIFERRQGAVWMYSRWCVEFDAQGAVVRLERDIATSGSPAEAAIPSGTLAAKAPKRP